MTNVKETTTVGLMNLIPEVETQEELNIIAYELACRIYVPEKGVNFDDLVRIFGYRTIDKKEKEDIPVKKLVR